MATTIRESFEQLRRNLEPTAVQHGTISTRQTSVRAAVEKGLTVKESFLTGSYSRKTLIAPMKDADIDIFTVLDNQYYYNYDQGKNGGQAGLLDLLKRTLKRTYPSTPDISRNGQAVTIRFSDFRVDVVPAFYRQGGGFLIPSSVSGSWISTDPRKHVELVSSSNASHNGDLVPLIKMVKCWNRNCGSYFRSFHLEVLALETLSGVTISDYPSGVRFYFDKARAAVVGRNLDPAGYGGDVGAYINTQQKLDEAVAKFQLAYDRALKAEGYASRGSISEAVDMWIKIFGGYLPSYG